MEEKEEKITTIRIPNEIHKQFRKKCFDSGISQNVILNELIKKYLGLKWN